MFLKQENSPKKMSEQKSKSPENVVFSGLFGALARIRTGGVPLRSSPDTTSGSETQYKKILGNTRFFTIFNPIWYYALQAIPKGFYNVHFAWN